MISPRSLSLALRCGALCGALGACGPRLPPPSFPGHEALYGQAEYTHGASALPYSRRLTTHEGLVAYLKELDGHLLLLRQLLDAHARVVAWHAPADAPEAYGRRLQDERIHLVQEIDLLGRIIRQFLDLGAAQRSFAIIPELREAIRLSRAHPQMIPDLPVPALHGYLLLLGSEEAACGTEQPDPVQDQSKLPAWYTTAQKALEDIEDGALKTSPAQQLRHRRLLSASLAQRQAIALYGPYRRIAAAPAGRPGEVWTFQIGSVEEVQPGASRSVDDRPRALWAECEYDAKGRLRKARDEVLDRGGQPVDLSRAKP